jgi:hypothetical protein
MPEIGKGYVTIEPDKDHFDRSIRGLDDDAGGRYSNIGKGIGTAIAKGIAVSLAAGAGLAVIGKSLVDSASDLNESLSKVNTVFGDFGDEVEQFSRDAAKNIGLSQNAALEATGTFGNLFDQMNIGKDVSFDMSTGLTTLAADLASFHNADITDVIEAQTAAFRGEYDSLQRFIPTINAAAVQQKALEMTGKRSTKELTEQDKVLATHTLMLEGAGAAVGDFARTSDGAANRQRILKAQFENLRAELGQRLLPVFQSVLGWLINDGIPALREFGGWLEDNVVPVLKDMGRVLAETVFPALVDVGKFIIDNQPILVGLIAALAAVFLIWAINAGIAAAATLAATWPILAVMAAIGLLVAAIVYAYTEWDWFRNAVDAVARFLTETLWPALQTIAKFILDEVVPRVRDLIGIWWEFHSAIFTIAGEVIGAFQSIWDFLTALPGNIKSALSNLADILLEPFEAAWEFIRPIVEKMQKAVETVVDLKSQLPGQGRDIQGGLDSGEIDRSDLPAWMRERAMGGPVRANTSYLVGERGPELFTPGVSGRITSNADLRDMAGAGGSSYPLTINATKVDGADVIRHYSYLELLAGMH